jgi:hypothetical protein
MRNVCTWSIHECSCDSMRHTSIHVHIHTFKCCYSALSFAAVALIALMIAWDVAYTLLILKCKAMYYHAHPNKAEHSMSFAVCITVCLL